ncbi:MAG: nucleoside deaminase [Gemmatimonadales bacterium]|jgi:tRNA(Arg) A34 adenosine deaminase TadA
MSVGPAAGAPGEVRIALPEWAAGAVDWERRYATDEEKVRLTVRLAQENVARGTGGPFGAAVLEAASGRLMAVGMNSVVRLSNAVLHAEIVAVMLAQQRLGTFSLAAAGLPTHELVTSCDPCAMCLGAILWSGVKRVVCGAAREDATALKFDEGPVFPASYDYLRQRGIAFVRGVCRDEARAVLELYRRRSGVIYNP